MTPYVTSSFLLLPKILENLSVVSTEALKKDIKIIYNIPEDLTVMADDNMLEGILRNLVSNAVKFTENGGSITVCAVLLANYLVEIAITDTGIGMSQNMMDNLFRLDKKTNRKGTNGELSTGLGLIICRDFIEKHGGKLNIESEVGKGSTFRFALPI